MLETLVTCLLCCVYANIMLSCAVPWLRVLQTVTSLSGSHRQHAALIGRGHANRSNKNLFWCAQVQVEMADAALWLYGIAFEEVQRHIAVECRERAQVLGCLWNHCCCLTELRCAVQYEALLAQSRKGFEGLADQRQYLKGQIRSAATTLKQQMYYDSIWHVPEGPVCVSAA